MPTKIQGLLATYSRERLKEALEKNKASENFAVRDVTKTPFVKEQGYVPAKENEINYTPSVDITDNVMGFMPIVGDVLQGGQAAIDFTNGDYKKAALNAGLLFVPNVLEKPIKYAGKLLRRFPVERAIAKNAPYVGRNFVRHGVPSGYVSDVLRGESRAMTPSLAVNRVDEFNVVGNTPFQYGDYTFIGDKSLLDDSIIFHGDAASPVIGDVIYGFDSVPSEMREEVAERLWQETINGPYKAIGKGVNIGDLSHLPTNEADTYFEAIHHGTVPYERFKGVIAEEPGRHLYPTGLSKNKEEDILNWFDNNGVKVKTYDPLYKPYAGYNGWAESILDMTQDFGDDVLFRDGGKIYIKPSHRGRLTELKARTGKTEAELYNDGNPAHKKMVVFARNARKWHADGGLLVDAPADIEYANKLDRISNARYKMANDALLRSGASRVDADRLARFLGAQSALEAGWVDDVSGHNYAGYMSNGKRMKFDNADAFWDYHLSNLDKKWPTWRNAQTIQEYYDIVNNTALGLTTKELFDDYNRKHRDNPAYIYAPDWDNNNYLKKLQGVYDKYITKYVKPLYSAGGLIEKYGVDRIRAAINQMRCGGKMHRYDGESEPTGQMNGELWYNPDFGTYELLPGATVVAPQTVVFNGRRVAVGDGSVNGGGERGAIPADIVANPVQRGGLLRQFPREGDVSPIADVFENDIVNARVHGRGDAGVIQGALSKVRNMSSDELSAFQRELYRAGYYGEVKAPKITAKTRDEVVRLQQMLKDAGYGDMLGTTGKNKDGVDGSLGSKTRAAWAAYVKDNESRALEGSVADGRFGPETRRAALKYYNDRKREFDSSDSEEVVRNEPVVKIDASEYDKILSDYGQLPSLRIGDGIYGGLVDAMNLAGFKRARKKAIESGDVGEDGVPMIDYGWAVTQDQLRRAAGFLPANLDINSQPEWQGINYRDTWDSPEYIAQNASGLGTMLKGMPGVLGMAGTSLAQPGRGTIGGFVWRTTPQGIEISDGYQFAAPASAVTIRDAQGDAYNEKRIEIANNERARNIRQQKYLVPWDVYRKLQEKRR